MSLEKLISEIASSHPVATRAQRVTGITHRVGDARQSAERAEQSASLANEGVLEAAESARQAGADVLETIRQIEAGELKSYIDLQDYIDQGKLAGQITGIYIANAAIDSAKIANLAVNSQHVNELTASKITSGDITASLINLTGRLEAGGGGVRLDGMGLALSPIQDSGAAPTERAGRKITNLGASKWTHYQVFEGGGVRGSSIRADGASGGDNGRVELISTAAGTLSTTSTGRIRVDAGGSGAVLIEGNITARNNFSAEGNLYSVRGAVGPGMLGTYARQRYYSPTTVGAGNTVAIAHGFSAVPDFIHVQANMGGWRTIAGNGSQFDVYADSDRVWIVNNSGAARSIRASIMNGS